MVRPIGGEGGFTPQQEGEIIGAVKRDFARREADWDAIDVRKSVKTLSTGGTGVIVQ